MQNRFAGYDVRPVAIDLGSSALTVLVVGDPERYVDRQALLRDEDAPEPPYWIHLWTGARALARLVAEHRAWAGKRVVELGCGLGLPGIAAASLGASVVMIDAVRDALRFARSNATLNGCSVAAVQTDLRRAAVRGPFDACLVADATYEPTLQRSIADFLARQLAPGGFAWCAESVRTFDPEFSRACAALGLAVEEREVREIEDGRVVPVRIVEVSRA